MKREEPGRSTRALFLLRLPPSAALAPLFGQFPGEGALKLFDLEVVELFLR